jgi:hypothetical protein
MAMESEHLTEAACLLQQGALYRKRIGLERAGDAHGPIFAGFKHGAFSLYFGDAPIYHFDLEGRWQRIFADGIHYLKGLDAEVHAVDRVREGPNLVLKRRRLPYDEAAHLDLRVRSVALELLAESGAGRLQHRDPPLDKARPLRQDELEEFLERISRWDSAAWFAHRERYLATYGPLPFLPPDCLGAVVLQATLGHAEGRSFGLSPVAEHYVRSPSEFAQHAREVSALWGRRLLQSRLAFLAGSDVLRRPVEDVMAYLDEVRRVFPIAAGHSAPSADPDEIDRSTPRLDGIHAFLDEFTPPRPDRAEWSSLAEKGLVRVSLGVESGDTAVRERYGKTWNEEDLRDTVADLKAAGLGISLLTLVGAGGVEHAEAHSRETARLIASLGLDRGDFVFLLDENEIRDRLASRPGLTFLERSDWAEEQRKLKDALAPMKGRGIKVLPYTLEKQWA